MTAHTLQSKRAYSRTPASRYSRKEARRGKLLERDYIVALERTLSAIEQYSRRHGIKYEAAIACEKGILSRARERYYSARNT